MGKASRNHFRRLPLLLAAAFFLMLPARGAQADIYRYIDEKGVLHFSNMPDKPQYRFYMKEGAGESPGPGEPSFQAADPDAFDNLIEEAATATGVDFDLIKAVMKVESAFNVTAVSEDGAKGLMQIMPANFSALGITDPFDPRQNIRGGADILAELLKSYDGSVSLSLAAYNAGLVAVKNHKAIPPYQETQNFVARVMTEFQKLKAGREGRAIWRRAGDKSETASVVTKPGRIPKTTKSVTRKPSTAADPSERDGRQAHIITLTPDGIRETITLRFDD
ncbi:MAG: lytic transglycosylase domain-containing protein [Thermodesulfobacteriota bacterium]